MNKLLNTLALAFIVCLSNPSQAAQWYTIGSNENILLLSDLQTVRKFGDITSIWMTQVNLDPKVKFDTSTVKVNIKCDEQLMAPVFYVEYLNGKMLKQSKFDIEWEYPIPGTHSMDLVEMACGNVNSEKYWPSLEHINSAGKVGPYLKPLLRPYFKSLKDLDRKH